MLKRNCNIYFFGAVLLLHSCVIKRKSVVRLITAGWKYCVWVCDIDTGLAHIGRWVLEKWILGQKDLASLRWGIKMVS